jgi:hypothetical protein
MVVVAYVLFDAIESILLLLQLELDDSHLVFSF